MTNKRSRVLYQIRKLDGQIRAKKVVITRQLSEIVRLKKAVRQKRKEWIAETGLSEFWEINANNELKLYNKIKVTLQVLEKQIHKMKKAKKDLYRILNQTK